MPKYTYEKDDFWSSDPLLTTFQAAAHLGVPRQTLSVWRSRKPPTGPAHIRIGRFIHYRLSDLDYWLDQQRIKPAGSINEKLPPWQR